MLWGCCGEIWGWKRYGVVMGLGSLWGCYGARVGLENATGLETVWGFYREMWGYYGAVVGLRNAGALPGGFYGAGEWRTLRALLWGGVCCGVRECSGAGNALGGCAEMWGGCGAGTQVDYIFLKNTLTSLVSFSKIKSFVDNIILPLTPLFQTLHNKILAKKK